MTNEHHLELRAMAQRMREIAVEQTNGRRLALMTLADQLECGSAMLQPAACGPLLPMPRAGE
ncbi:hypothetical protein M2352_004474 [Azospirillum fermentarium]|uniref:hypothetical protein n=1 Tax=Azospirillum fermentarium TaxID=1233114 RepID=UPI002225D7A7|nr:hypothetical protein [Azospirillum fermentarium]MCW2248814.1 hypothetical protein [Azospirillum fermentarium]